MLRRWFTVVFCAALLPSCGVPGSGDAPPGGDSTGSSSSTSGGGTTSTGSGATSGCTAKGADRPGWDLVWCDEFDGPAIDETKWTFEIGDGADKPSGAGWGNQEKEYYTRRSANAKTQDGNLIISALKDGPHYANGGTAYDYSSARMTTHGKADWTFGRIEARAKLPRGQGLWPAFWMLPTSSDYGGWAASGEIDIMEFKGQTQDTVYGTLHFGDQWPKNAYVSCPLALASGNFVDEFHVFAAEWGEDGIRMFVDDMAYETQYPRGGTAPASVCVGPDGKTPTAPNASNADPNAGYYSGTGDPPAPFDRPFYILLNVAVGGQFVGGTIDPSVFPQTMVVDYVRVYQKSK